MLLLLMLLLVPCCCQLSTKESKQQTQGPTAIKCIVFPPVVVGQLCQPDQLVDRHEVDQELLYGQNEAVQLGHPNLAIWGDHRAQVMMEACPVQTL